AAKNWKRMLYQKALFQHVLINFAGVAKLTERNQRFKLILEDIRLSGLVHRRKKRRLPFLDIFAINVVVGFATEFVEAPGRLKEFLESLKALRPENDAMDVRTAANREWGEEVSGRCGDETAVIVHNR